MVELVGTSDSGVGVTGTSNTGIGVKGTSGLGPTDGIDNNPARIITCSWFSLLTSFRKLSILDSNPRLLLYS